MSMSSPSEPTTGLATETEVIVVGAGPVGLTLAHELGSRGIDVVLVEPRTEPDASSPRCKQINPRSMEQFRRLGLADAIRATSLLPFGWSDSAVFCTSMFGHEIERFDGVFGMSDVPWSELAEPGQWTAQFRVEAALRGALSTRESVRAYWGSRLVDLEQDESSVVATVRDAGGHPSRVRGRYLAAADGGRSTVRRLLGVPLDGRSHGIENLQVIFDAPGLGAHHPHGAALQYWILNPEISGLLGPLDTEDAWWAIVVDAPAAASSAWTEHALRMMVGGEVPVRVRSQDPWTARMLLAERFRAGRCFLLGDAAHLNPPWGGFGANTGIGDAVDLGWKLAAVVSGWGGPGLLDSYEAERRPVAAAAIAAAERNMQVLTPELSRPDLDDETPAAVEARVAAAEAIRRAKVSETYTLGFVLGLGYPDSPVVARDEVSPACSEGSRNQASAAPGMRLPHLWLGPGHSLFDRLGPGFTLLEIGAPHAAELWETVAAQRGMPLRTLRLNRPDAQGLYGARYVLVRPDHVIAWRGDTLPTDPRGLLDRVRGAGSPPDISTRADADSDALQSRFRDAMASVCTPVSVVTTVREGQPHGTTVSAFASLSMDPPMVLVSLDRGSELLLKLRETGRFGLNVLGSGQYELARIFARKGGAAEFDGVPWWTEAGVARLPDVGGFLACDVVRMVPGGDHVVVLGLVRAAEAVAGPPLTYFARSFGTHAAPHEDKP